MAIRLTKRAVIGTFAVVGIGAAIYYILNRQKSGASTVTGSTYLPTPSAIVWNPRTQQVAVSGFNTYGASR